MNVSFTKKNLIILVVAVVVAMILITSLYITSVTPMYQARSNAENQLETEYQMLELLQEQAMEQEEIVDEQTTHLQRKLPVDPLIDQLLLDLQRVEALSNTFILDMNFLKDRPANLIVREDEDAEATVVVEETELLKEISANLSIVANSYEDLFQFLAEIDRLPRIVSIDSISFVGTNEQMMINDQIENLHFLVTISAFYYPELPELKEELPKVIHPEPGEKRNPLYNR